MYLLQFTNFYSTSIYIALFKGRFAGTPYKYNYFLGYRHEECGASGCMADLCIHLTVIMTVKPFLDCLQEHAIPFLIDFCKYRIVGKGKIKCRSKGKSSSNDSQWAKDFSLKEWDFRAIFLEYLKIIIQFGFIAIFFAAFPLAPLFALVTNVIELRFDAKKFLKRYRRPVSKGVPSIGIWYTILDLVGKLGVISNAFVIAFTSSFIPKLVYRWENGGSLEGFVNQSLHYFNTSLFLNESLPLMSEGVPVCRYQSYSYEKFPFIEKEKQDFYWKVLLARLAFVVFFVGFQTVVSCIIIVILEWFMPHVPYKTQNRIQEENRIVSDAILEHNLGNQKAKLLETAV